jgi:hypothetical protein
MGTPKIKAYQLPNGYSEEGDNDIQSTSDDELIPVVDKPVTPEDFKLLTPVKLVTGESLTSVDTGTGQWNANLTPNEAEFQYPDTGHTDMIVTAPSGIFGITVFDSNSDIVDPSGYVASVSGVQFLSAPYPSGATISYFRAGPEVNTDFIGFFENWYDGDNWEHRPVVYDSSGNALAEGSDYTMTAASGWITLNAPASGITADYSARVVTTNTYIADRENWIFNHLYMNPDIFKGLFDYPGDDTEDPQGNPILQGEIPEFVEDSEYQIDFRRGLVIFPSEFDSSVEPVHGNFAYLVGVRNVTGQELQLVNSDPSGVGYQYRATVSNQFPESIGAPWIDRNDSFTPRNFYVDGDLKPRLITKTPFDELTIKQGP